MTESFVIQSDITNLALVENRVFHFCNLCNVGNYYSAIVMAVRQAVSNAMVHGNGSDPAKQVAIELGQMHGGIFAEVKDQGQGFDYAAYGSLPEEGKAGSGIFVMSQLSDRMRYSDGGRTLRLEFDVEGIAPSDALARVAHVRAAFSSVGSSYILA